MLLFGIMSLIILYISASLFTGIFVLPLLLISHFKKQDKAIFRYIIFFLSYFMTLISWGSIYAMENLNLQFKSDIVYLISFISLLLIFITLPITINYFFNINRKEIFSNIFITIGILLFLLVFLFSFDYLVIYFAILFSFTYSLFISISKFKSKENFNRIIAVIIIVFNFLVIPVAFYDLIIIDEDQLMLSFGFFFVLNVVTAIVFTKRFNETILNSGQKKDYRTGYELTPREIEVMTLLLNGISYKEIANELFISVATVKTHINKIYKKTGAKTRHELSTWFN